MRKECFSLLVNVKKWHNATFATRRWDDIKSAPSLYLGEPIGFAWHSSATLHRLCTTFSAARCGGVCTKEPRNSAYNLAVVKA